MDRQDPVRVHSALKATLASGYMKTDGQQFLQLLDNFPPNRFGRRFSATCARLGLGLVLDRNELNLLYEAAYCATLCQIAFNGLGGCKGQIKPEREATRTRLEWDFMAVRNRFCACRGWHALGASTRFAVRDAFLTILVANYNLAR
jgi:hypothetical protein